MGDHNWVKADERLPEPHQYVLVYSPWDSSSMDVLYYEPDDGVHAFGWYPGGADTEGTYWQPLPVPPLVPAT